MIGPIDYSALKNPKPGGKAVLLPKNDVGKFEVPERRAKPRGIDGVAFFEQNKDHRKPT